MSEKRKKYNAEYQKRYYGAGSDNRARKNLCRRIAAAEIREQILDMYGHKCSICGFDDARALQLDHINSKPFTVSKHRSGTALYRQITNGLLSRELFQLLCANCNTIKRVETAAESPRHRKDLIEFPLSVTDQRERDRKLFETSGLADEGKPIVIDRLNLENFEKRILEEVCV